jgi:acetylornithine deacetylase
MEVRRTSGGIRVVDRERLVGLASGLAGIRSTRDTGEAEIGRFLLRYLEDTDLFDVDVQDVVLDRFNVMARLPGRPEFQSIMLNGHLDMPDPVAGWERDPYGPVVEGDSLYGAALTDMKGGLASLVAGAEAAARALRGRPHGEVILTAVMYHDTIGLGTKYFLAANDHRLDAGINGEPTALKIQLAHGGAYQFKVRVPGVTAHNSRQEDAVNALDAAVDIAQALKRDVPARLPEDRDMPFLPRLVLGRLAGGTGASVTAAECVIEGDIRYPPSVSPDEIRAAVGDVVRASVRAEGGRFRPRVYQSRIQRPFVADPNWPIVRCLAEAHRAETDADVVFTKGLPAGAYITDAADMAKHGIPTVIYGPGDWRLIPDERISISEMTTAAQVYARTVVEWVTTRRT